MNLKKEWHYKEFIQSEASITHRPMEEEFKFYKAIQDGDLAFIEENCKNNVFSNPKGMGVLSKNPVQNLKYHFTITAAMVTRFCVEGGMELEKAYRLSDFYMQMMDECTTIEEISELHTSMCYDFAEKMKLLHNNDVISKPIVLCVDYIYKHLHSRITIKELAAYTGFSEGYISKLFRKEMGVTVSDYIRDQKIDTAKNLLVYSDFSLVDISCYLAFSSQSHFNQTFQKVVGISPKKYRDKYFRACWNEEHLSSK